MGEANFYYFTCLKDVSYCIFLAIIYQKRFYHTIDKMEDDDLAEIRAKRMAELGMGAGGGGGGGGGAQQQQEAMQKQQEAKSMMLAQCMDQTARARLNTLAMTKPDKARMVENMILQTAQRGQLGGKIGEEELKGLLERVSSQTSQKNYRQI